MCTGKVFGIITHCKAKHSKVSQYNTTQLHKKNQCNRKVNRTQHITIKLSKTKKQAVITSLTQKDCFPF